MAAGCCTQGSLTLLLLTHMHHQLRQRLLVRAVRREEEPLRQLVALILLL